MSTTDLTAFLDARQNQLALEVGGGDAIDAKALGLLGSNIAILIFTAQSSLHNSVWLISLIVLLLTSSFFDVLTTWPREYSGASVSALDHPEYLTYDTQALVSQLIADTEAAIAKNKKLNKKRLSFIATSLTVTVLASLLLLILL
jgi:hypothetical protein